MNVKRLNLTPPYQLKLLEQVAIYLNLIMENNGKQVNQHYNFKQISSRQAPCHGMNPRQIMSSQSKFSIRKVCKIHIKKIINKGNLENGILTKNESTEDQFMVTIPVKTTCQEEKAYPNPYMYSSYKRSQ